MIPSASRDGGSHMRGSDKTSGSLLSYVDLESRVPSRHPLRVIKAIGGSIYALSEFLAASDILKRPEPTRASCWRAVALG